MTKTSRWRTLGFLASLSAAGCHAYREGFNPARAKFMYDYKPQANADLNSESIESILQKLEKKFDAGSVIQDNDNQRFFAGEVSLTLEKDEFGTDQAVITLHDAGGEAYQIPFSEIASVKVIPDAKIAGSQFTPNLILYQQKQIKADSGLRVFHIITYYLSIAEDIDLVGSYVITLAEEYRFIDTAISEIKKDTKSSIEENIPALESTINFSEIENLCAGKVTELSGKITNYIGPINFPECSSDPPKEDLATLYGSIKEKYVSLARALLVICGNATPPTSQRCDSSVSDFGNEALAYRRAKNSALKLEEKLDGKYNLIIIPLNNGTYLDKRSVDVYLIGEKGKYSRTE